MSDIGEGPSPRAEGLDWLFSGFGRSIDRGGLIKDYQARIQAAQGTHVISGDCMSACTLWLQYKNTCVERDATLWFHAAMYGQDYLSLFRGPWRNISASASSKALDLYPAKLRAFIKENGWLERPDFNRLTGEELAKFGVALCEGGDAQRQSGALQRELSLNFLFPIPFDLSFAPTSGEAGS